MNKMLKIILLFQKEGIVNTLRFIVQKLFIRKISNYKRYQGLFYDKKGIEIGGPSSVFKKYNILPIYSVINSLDGVNFSTMTIWEGVLKKGENYKYEKGKRVGYQYICDAVDLNMIPSEKYDFVLSCNALEHIANPFRAINEWLRIIKPNGILLLVLPRKESNFDHKREITILDHLKDDYNHNIEEDDLSHLGKILKLHDLSMDPPAGTLEQFKDRSVKNYENRALHHHVFDMNLLKNIYGYFNIEILLTDTTVSDFIIVGRKR
jgi:SAM-dependent methyltransferase